MSFTYVDAGVAVVVFLSAVLAWNRGFTREAFAIGGWILATLAAFFFAPKLEPLMRELPVVGPQLAKSCVISMIAAFAVIVALSLLVLAVFTPIFASAVLESALGPVDRALGLLFGVARGVLLLAVAYLIYSSLSGDEIIPALEQAATKPMFDEAAALLAQYKPEQMPDWFSGRIDALMAPCQEVPAGDAATPPAAQN
ncbi:MAG: CvpA family protein [Pseudomonadota bacterium]